MAEQTWTSTPTSGVSWQVPDDVTEVEFDVAGSSGQAGPTQFDGSPGSGGRVTGRLSVIPGETLQIVAPGGYLRAADIRSGGVGLQHQVVVAGSGGNGGRYGSGNFATNGGHGGNAGGSGSVGPAAEGNLAVRGLGGGAGGASQGGSGGPGGTGGASNGQAGSAGSQGEGGSGGSGGGQSGFGSGGAGGTGGRGWYGGGGGGGGALGVNGEAGGGGGGGGGSSYADPDRTSDVSYGGNSGTSFITLRWVEEAPPSAPTIQVAEPAPSGEVAVGWQHSPTVPPDAPQTGWALQIRPLGSSDLEVDADGEDDRASHDAVLDAGMWEARARTATGAGFGPWSAWTPFQVADRPPPPLIVNPSEDGTVIAVSSYTYQADATAADALRWFRHADDEGDPGEMLDQSGVRRGEPLEWTFTHPVNHVTEHVAVQVRVDGLWSHPAWRRVSVDYLPPAVPDVTIVEDQPEGAVSIETSYPPPSDDPEPVSMDIWRRTDSQGPIRIATDVEPGEPHTDWTVASDAEVEYRVVTFADNDTESTSGWHG